MFSLIAPSCKSDAKVFAGANRVNSKAIKAQMIPWHNRPQSMEITLPEFTICVFKVKKIITPSELEKKLLQSQKGKFEDRIKIPIAKEKEDIYNYAKENFIPFNWHNVSLLIKRNVTKKQSKRHVA